MKIKLKIRQSFDRFTKIQKVVSLFWVISILLSIAILLFSKDLNLSLVLCLIATGITLFIFNMTKQNRPFVFTKISVEKYHLMGEANFYKVEKTFTSDSISNRKFRSKYLLMIREYRQDGSLFLETPYKNGKIWGEVKTFAVDGKIRKSATYYEGEIEGKEVELDGNTLAKEHNYKGALLHGLSKSYDKETGNIISEESFKYGAHHGPSFYYNPKTGAVTKEENYKNGKKYGKEKIFDEKNQIITETDYVNGMIHGQLIEYYENGEKKSVTEYQKDKRDGNYKEYYENGTIKTECRYREDNKHGPHLSYYKSGVIMTRNFFEDGKKKGEAIFYDPEGNPVG